MPDPRPPFLIVLRAAHRRWVAWRALECAGLCLLGGCVAAVPVVLLLWLRHEPALPAVAVVLGLSLAIGVAWGAARRPTLLGTAIEADRQFNLHDLLGTALTLEQCPHADEATRAAIVALADARCRERGASALVLQRLGARAWSGVGLAVALVLTLALMTGTPAELTARVAERDAVRWSARDHATPPPTDASPLFRLNLPRAAPAQDPAEDGPAAAPARQPAGDPARDSSDDATASATAAGGGSAAGRTDSSAAGGLNPSVPPRAGASPTGDIAAGGAAGAAAAASDEGDAAAGGTSAALPSRPAAPWQGSSWREDRARAMRAVERGTIPDSYRQLVLDYFDRDGH